MTGYKFQRLTVYNMALDYLDKVYELSRSLPASERFNLQSQLERAATSIVLNIAEGSTSQSDGEQNRFLGLALRSYLETVASMDIIERQGYLTNGAIRETREQGHDLFVRLQAFRKSLNASVSGLPSPVPHLQSSAGSLPSPVSRLRSSVKDSQ